MASACAAEPGLVMKKGELPKTRLHLLSHQPPSPSFRSTLSKMHLAMFEYFLMSKCVLMSDWHLSSTLTAKLITKNSKYFTFARYLLEVTFDLFQAALIVELSTDDIALLNK